MPAVRVPLGRDEFDKLLALARQERRQPPEQAAVIIARAAARAPDDHQPRRPRGGPMTAPQSEHSAALAQVYEYLAAIGRQALAAERVPDEALDSEEPAPRAEREERADGH
jgi:hypothetical protein